MSKLNRQTHGEKTVSVDPLSSRGINKFHLEGDFHLESDIEAIKVYQLCFNESVSTILQLVVARIVNQLKGEYLEFLANLTNKKAIEWPENNCHAAPAKSWRTLW